VARRCFCGCGREVRGKRKGANLVGKQTRDTLALIEGRVLPDLRLRLASAHLENSNDSANDRIESYVGALIERGRHLQQYAQAKVHGEPVEGTWADVAEREWWEESHDFIEDGIALARYGSGWKAARAWKRLSERSRDAGS
jgi:hypothetical protein